MVFALNDDPMQIDKTWLKPLIEQEKQCWHVNNLSCLSKPHYPITKIQKNNSYTTIMQLSFGYYNYYATIPLKIKCINK
jgi:hypothetical protein